MLDFFDFEQIFNDQNMDEHEFERLGFLKLEMRVKWILNCNLGYCRIIYKKLVKIV